MITYKGLLPGEEMSINTYIMRVWLGRTVTVKGNAMV